MEEELKRLVPGVEDESTSCLESIVALLNYRDKVIKLLCEGLLFQKTLLDLELKIPRAEPNLLMSEFTQYIQAFNAREGTLPEKHRLADLPSAHEAGFFTYDKSNSGAQTATGSAPGTQGGTSENDVSLMQSTLLTMLKEAQSLDKGIRHVKFGEKVTIPDKHRNAGKVIGSDELRPLITKAFDKCSRLEHELQMRKAQRHTPWEVQVDFFKLRCQEKDQQSLQYKSKVHKLEGDVSSFKQEFANLRREKAELAEKNRKMVTESLPDLDRIDADLTESRTDVDRLTADAEMLSSMFRLQVEDSNRSVAARDEVAKDRKIAKKQLKDEREHNRLKDDEQKKKETLYQRTVEARASTHKAYLEQKTRIKEVTDMAQEQEEEWQKMAAELERRDHRVEKLRRKLRHSYTKIDELEQEKKAVMHEFHTLTGHQYCMLLEQFKVVQTPESAST